MIDKGVSDEPEAAETEAEELRGLDRCRIHWIVHDFKQR